MYKHKIEFGEFLILNFGGYAVSLLGGILGAEVAHIPYPLDWLLWLPGWIMMAIASLARLL